MPDWRDLVEQHLARLRLPPHVREEVWTELSNHLEELYEQFLATGLGEREAVNKTLEFIPRWEVLGCGIEREKEGIMSTFGKQFILPSGLAFAMATVALAIEIRLGPPPAVWNFDIGALVIYRFWSAALLITGAISAYLSMRAGASKSRRVLVALTPSLYILLVMFFVMAVVLSTHLLKWMPYQPIYWMAFLIALANWVALPGLALLLGAMPFVGKPAGHSQVMA